MDQMEYLVLYRMIRETLAMRLAKLDGAMWWAITETQRNEYRARAARVGSGG